MNVKDIPRLKFDADKAVSDERVQLAKNAREKLGYTMLSRAIAEPDTLLFALHKLGIEPLDTEHVNAYRATKEKKGMW